MFARGLAFALFVATVTFGAGTPAKATQLTQTVLSQCVSEVRAPGSFSLVEGPDDAVLVSATGASQASIAKVNDCLADKQQIQYATLAFSGVSTEGGGATSVRKSFGGRCLGGKSVLQGGTGYCVD